MKRLIAFMVPVLVLMTVPAFGQQYCYGSAPATCQYLEDTGLQQGTTYWNYSSGSGQSTVTDPCSYGGTGTTGAADLENGDSVYQTVETGDYPVWSLRLDLYKTTTSVTASDYFTVYVHNYDTNVTETFYAEASSESDLCIGVINFDLAYDHSNSTVRVRIVKNFYSTTDMYVDNVALFGKSM